MFCWANRLNEHPNHLPALPLHPGLGQAPTSAALYHRRYSYICNDLADISRIAFWVNLQICPNFWLLIFLKQISALTRPHTGNLTLDQCIVFQQERGKKRIINNNPKRVKSRIYNSIFNRAVSVVPHQEER